MSPADSSEKPLDEAGVGANWIVLRFLLHAVAGVFSGRVLLLAAVGLTLAELNAWAGCGCSSERFAAVRLPAVATDALALDAAALFDAAWASQLAFSSSMFAPWRDGQTFGAGFGRIVAWSLFGVAIARVAATHLTHNERPTARAAARRSLGSWGWQLLGPLVLIAIAAAGLGLVWLAGYASRLAFLGSVIGVLYPLVILVALLTALLAIGVAVGTPLIWAAWATERPDPFDAVSSAIAYVYQRPLRLLCYTAQALLVGAAAASLIVLATQATQLVLTAWSHGLGDRPEGASSIADSWIGAIAYAPYLFHAAYFWFAATAVYLLMRRDIDGKQCDEIYSEEESSSPAPSPPSPPDASPTDA